MDSPMQTLSQMIWGANKVQIIYVAAKLGIAEALKQRPLLVDDLARTLHTHPNALYRYMRAASSLGIFTEGKDGAFGLTALSELLLPDAQDSQKNTAIICGENWSWRAWGSLLRCIETGMPAIELEFGMGLYEYFSVNQDAGARFNSFMATGAAAEAALITDIYDFAGVESFVDVAGGHGSLLAAVLNKNPAMRGVLAEQPSVLDVAKSYLESEGVYDRCKLTSTDILQAVPPKGDLYIMKRVTTAFDDSSAVKILSNCRSVMKKDTRLLIADPIVPSDNNPHHSKVFDLNMLLIGGAFRTLGEYRNLLKKADMKLVDTIQTEGAITILVCIAT